MRRSMSSKQWGRALLLAAGMALAIPGSPWAAGGAPSRVTLEVDDSRPALRSEAFLLADQATGQVLLERNADEVVPIASITKLMTAMVVLDASQGLSDVLRVARDDVDTLRGSRSRLPVGARLSREDMLQLALMSSENRAASALARYYPGGTAGFIEAMNVKARLLGLEDTRFVEPTGLSARNVSSARDLARLVSAAARYPLIRAFSTAESYEVNINGRSRRFGNTNGLVKSPDWRIGVSKTGYIREAGRCLVMQAWIMDRPMIVVLLDSFGKYTRTADARRIKRWIESGAVHQQASIPRDRSG
ncbi:MAG: D-alanyl-D-alanine endopeptidase [Rhodocyclaceae bacterium]|nr:D-alanyl-D-alanine endopeptidase [Rhodocyclaceae bacterium]